MPLFPLAGLLWLRRSMPLPSHTNPGFEITHLLSGRVSWRVEGGPTLRLTGGDMAITQPGVPHQGELEVIEPCRLFWFVVNPEAFEPATLTSFTSAELHSTRRILAEAGNRIAKAGAELRSAHLRMAQLHKHSEDPASERLRLPRIRMILADGLLSAVASLARSTSQGQPHPIVDAARIWLERNFQSPEAGIAALCAAMGYSASHLLSLFKRHLGQTPSDYLQRLRIDKALEMLGATETPIGEISMRLGFPSSQYFADRFRRFTGLSPKEYRSERRRR